VHKIELKLRTFQPLAAVQCHVSYWTNMH